MVPLDHGERSTLYWHEGTGLLKRRHHDTGRWSGPWVPRVVEDGTRRCSGNRCIAALQRNCPVRPNGRAACLPPAHLHTARSVVARGASSVADVARQMGVKCSTAWSYVCRVVEVWPAMAPVASALVHPPIYRAVLEEPDHTGSLHELWDRIRVRVGDEVRSLDDHYAHLRLARLCAAASGQE